MTLADKVGSTFFRYPTRRCAFPPNATIGQRFSNASCLAKYLLPHSRVTAEGTVPVSTGAEHNMDSVIHVRTNCCSNGISPKTQFMRKRTFL